MARLQDAETEQHSRRLVEFADRQYEQLADKDADSAQDLKIDLSAEQLAALTSPQFVARLRELLADRHDEIVLRRCQAHGKHIRFHGDESLRTLQLSLNGDDEYEGGRLAYLTRGRLQLLAKPAGTVTVHDNRIVHGVTLLQSGVRYGLFLLKQSN